MSQQNLSKLRIDQAWIDQLLVHVKAAIKMLEDKDVALTADQRLKPTIGQKNSQFADNGVELIRDNPSWFPADFDRNEVLGDDADFTVLKKGDSAMSRLAELFDDAMHGVGSDILTGVYDAKPCITNGAALSREANDKVAEFLAYFKRNRTLKTPPPTPPAK